MADWITLVEAAYELDGDLSAWLDRVIRCATPLLDSGDGVWAGIFTASTDGRLLSLRRQGSVATETMSAHLQAFAEIEAETLEIGRGRPISFSTILQYLGRDPDWYFRVTGGRYRDGVGLATRTLNGHGLFLNTPLRESREVGEAERRRWLRIAAHLGAGLRLRISFEEATAPEPEAVLEGGGKLHDASGPAQSPRGREYLREAVKRRERARTGKQRGDADAALALWEGLIAGQWTLVDRFESDGKRYIVAHRNDPELGDPRGLARRERQVAEYLGYGCSPKEIAYSLGIGASAVSNSAARAVRKLGLGGRAELASFFAHDGLRAQLAELEVAGERLAAGAVALLDAGRLAALTGAEREVALDLLRGATIAAIAARRTTSPRTVESQVKSIYAKLAVSSRVELAALLGRSGTATARTPPASSPSPARTRS